MALDNIDYGAGQDDMSDVFDKVNLAIDAVNGITFDNTLLTKVVEIGDWDMDATASLAVPHGIADFTKIRSVNTIIRFDGGSLMYDIYSPTVDGYIAINSTDILLVRADSGYFDSTSFNQTSFNRGWVTITYTT